MNAKLVMVFMLCMVVTLFSSTAYGQSYVPRLVTEIRTNSSVSIGYYGIGQVSCNNDEILTGGGYYSPNFHQYLSVYHNGPSDDGKKWIVEMIQSTWHYIGPAPQFTTYAMCTKMIP